VRGDTPVSWAILALVEIVQFLPNFSFGLPTSFFSSKYFFPLKTLASNGSRFLQEEANRKRAEAAKESEGQKRGHFKKRVSQYLHNLGEHL